jgi:hypothetical protein
MDTTEQVSAIDRLAALDAAMTPGPWGAPETRSDCIIAPSPTHPGKVTVVAYGPEDDRFLADAEGIAALHNALPEIIAVLRIAEEVEALHDSKPLACPLAAALAALDAKVAK